MKKTLLFLISVVFLFANNTQETIVEVGCSHYRPYVDEVDGKVSGPGYDIAKDVLNNADIKFKYKVLPWARVYQYGLHKKNYLVGCLGRTNIRENLFQWVGPMEIGVKLYFYALKSNPITLKSVKEAKEYKIAAEKDTYNDQYLVANKFPKKRVKSVVGKVQMLEMLKHKRVDLLLLNDEELNAAAKKGNIDPSIFKKVIYVFSVQSYLAFSNKTPKELVDKVKNSYDQLNKDGKIKIK